MRKIIHIDMDAFYASVELLDHPQLRGLPVVVAWDAPRSVICAASYEARQFGLRSAMSVSRAKQLCPQAVYIAPHFERYREVSAQIHGIFRRYTDLIEPLSLDEAYLDVTHPKTALPSATHTAAAIRAEIAAATGLTASAGIAPNKFLAKIASDWNKPNGQCVIAPAKVDAFLATLPLEKIPGVGSATLAKMHRIGLFTGADLRQRSVGELVHHFGRYGYRLYDLARGIDERAVKPNRERVQISTETTLADDVPLSQISALIPELAEDLWRQIQKKRVSAHSVTLKLKTESFKTVTRSITYHSALSTPEELIQAAGELRARVNLPESTRYRLIGLGVSHLFLENEPQQLGLPALFDGAAS